MSPKTPSKGTLLKDGMKTCSGCLKEQSVDCFAGNSNTQDGLSRECRDCYWDDYLHRRYGIRSTDYFVMFEQQQGRCGVCEQNGKDCNVKSDKKWLVRMNPDTGKLHLVCRRCVRSLGRYSRKGTLAKNGIKKCSGCLENKATDEFYKRNSGRTKDGYCEECKECVRRRQLKYLYGITATEYWEMVERQDDRCDCCCMTKEECNHPNDKYWYVDHCHGTGRVRGLVCHSCNMLIGYAETLKGKLAVFDYLHRYDEQTNISSSKTLSA